MGLCPGRLSVCSRACGVEKGGVGAPRRMEKGFPHLVLSTPVHFLRSKSPADSHTPHLRCAPPALRGREGGSKECH